MSVYKNTIAWVFEDLVGGIKYVTYGFDKAYQQSTRKFDVVGHSRIQMHPHSTDESSRIIRETIDVLKQIVEDSSVATVSVHTQTMFRAYHSINSKLMVSRLQAGSDLGILLQNLKQLIETYPLGSFEVADGDKLVTELQSVTISTAFLREMIQIMSELLFFCEGN